MTSIERQNARAQAADLTRVRGTSKVPQPPRDVTCQAAPQGLFVTWHYPPVNMDIQRWRVYRNDEKTLFAEIKDRGTRQVFVDGTNGVTMNVFVSSLNAAGIESAKVHSVGTPAAATATNPGVPSGYNSVNSGGRDTSTDFQ